MWPTIWDIKTGEKKECRNMNFPASWWMEGNGSCDCNRAIAMGRSNEMYNEMRKEHPELKKWQSVCKGTKRFLIIDCHGDLEGFTKDEIIREANSEYEIETKSIKF